MLRQKLYLFIGLLLIPLYVDAISIGGNPQSYYTTSSQTFQSMSTPMCSPNRAGAFGSSLGDPDEPGNWSDPFGGGGSIGGDDSDPSDPMNWADPFGNNTLTSQDEDPDNWADPYSHVPVGNIPWLPLLLALCAYTIAHKRKSVK